MLDERTAVDFVRMKDGTAEEYAFLQREEAAFAAGTAERVLAGLRALEDSMGGYRVSRLDHSLQSAARAERDGADIDWIFSALLHDIGDALAPHNHSQLAASVVEPYVREECSWVVRHHGAFQMIYYGHYIGLDSHARERYRGNPHYPACVEFCERWDQASFDPDYDTPPLEHFAPMVREVFARDAWDSAVIGKGVQRPLSRQSDR